jgi:hypothetical protein
MSDDRLRVLFDVLDGEATEQWLRAALDVETTDPGRADVLTHLARVAFWLDRPEKAESSPGRRASHRQVCAGARSSSRRPLTDIGRPVDAAALAQRSHDPRTDRSFGDHFGL